MSESSHNQRRHFRLRYPVIDRPSLRIGAQEYQVCELAEGGLQFALHADADFQLGAVVEGAIMFHDDQLVTIAGIIGRLQPPFNIIVDLQGIDFARMLKEQMHLRKKYPDVRSF